MQARHWTVGSSITVWLASIEDVAEEEWPRLFGQMDPPRQVRCSRYRRPEDRQRCILADALARLALAQVSGADPASLSFSVQPGGKPFVPGLPWAFSLSHSASLVLCAVAPFPVGADIQCVRPVSPALLRRAAQAGYDGPGGDDFFRWWTRQEAAGKLSGQGLRLGPLPEDVDFWTVAVEGGYFVSICGEKGLFFS